MLWRLRPRCYRLCVRRGFTLIELLVVVAVIAILVGLLLPALGLARKSARSAACLSSLHGIGHAMFLYSASNREIVIPSYTMSGVVAGPESPFDGWAPILDRDGYMEGASRGGHSNPFYCADTFDVDGVAAGQTGTDPNNPKGWLDWPFVRTGNANIPVTIPERRFHRIIRVSYWINSDNPVGRADPVIPDLYYTGSVGYGPGSNGVSIEYTKTTAFARPAHLIALADGVYAGRQRDTRCGTPNSRIGYRHPGRSGTANTLFADGHVQPIGGLEFPRGLGGTNNPDHVREDNLNGRLSVYANPERTLAR